MSEKCPYQDICATIVFWSKEQKDFIEKVCDTKEHESCIHFQDLNLNPEWVKEARAEKIKRGIYLREGNSR